MLEEYIYNTIHHSEKPECYSISKLRTLTECSEKYKLKYIQKIKREDISNSLLIGSLIHDALEQYYLNKQQNFVEYYLIQNLKDNLIKFKIIPELDLNNPVYIKLINLIFIYLKNILNLYLRGKETNCFNPILTAQGNLPKYIYSTTAWKKSKEYFNLNKIEIKINNLINKLNTSLSSEFNLLESIGEAYTLAYLYQNPKEYELENIHALEFPISDYNYQTKELINPFKYTNKTNQEFYVTGYIDYVGKVKIENQSYLAVIDYKSGKSDYEIQHIKYNPQLLFYALAYEKITQHKVEVVGIHNLQSNNLVLSKINTDLQKDILNSFFHKQEIVHQNIFIKHLPENKYSPCLNSFNKPCSYLQDCYPEFLNIVNK